MNCPRCGHSNARDQARCEKCDESLTGELPTVLNAPPSHADTQAETEIANVVTQIPSEGVAGLPMGSVLGERYEILELLGEGGMGRVYKARDIELDKVVALKTMRPELEANKIVFERFKQELLLARKVTHKNVIRIYDLGLLGGTRFFTMEYIEGESLRDVIRSRGKIPYKEALPIAKQILAALGEAHSQGVIHRDLKPGNILIDADGDPHIMDFGIARSTDSKATKTGAVLGTPDYMSPEQVRGERVGAQSDLYAFGIILYEMLTGDVPYKGETSVSTMVMRLTKKPRAPREINAEIPRYLENLILKCLEAKRSRRHQTAGEILHDLERQQVARPLLPRLWDRVERYRWAIVAVAVVAVAAVGLPLFLKRGPAVPTATTADGPVTTLAILPLTNTTGSPDLEWMRSGLAGMIVTDLSQSRYVRPVPAERTNRVLESLGLDGQTRYDEASLESIAHAAGADALLYGQFVESGGQLRLDLSLRRAGTGVLVPLKIEGEAVDVFAMVDRLSQGIKENLDLTDEQLREDTDRPIAQVSTTSIEALRVYQDGLAAYQTGANQTAIPLFKKAAEIDASFAMAHARLAEAYLAAGDHVEARAAIKRARDLAETRPLPLAERYQIHATAAWVEDDYESALENYDALDKLFPDDPDIELNRARLYFDTGRLTEAIAAYEKVVEAEPDYGAALLGLGRAQVAAGLPREAIESARRALETGRFADDPESLGMIHSILGVAHREISEHDEALAQFEKSLDYRRAAGDRRGQAVSLNNIAIVHAIRGENDRAIQAQNEAIRIAREMGDRERESNVLADMAIIHKMAGDLDAALAAYRESLRIEMDREDHTNMGNRLNAIAEIYRIQGKYDDAIVYLEQARSHLEKSEDLRDKEINLNYIGLIKKSQGLYDEALEAYMAALPMAQEIEDVVGSASIRKDLGEIYFVQGRYADAHDAFLRSLDLFEHAHHDVVEVQVPLANLYVALGMPEEAEPLLAEPEHDDHGGHGGHSHGLGTERLLARARLVGLSRSAGAIEEAVREAEHAGRTEDLLEARTALGRAWAGSGKTSKATGLLSETRRQAREARLRPLEAAAGVALAETYLAAGDAEAARLAALDAIELAEGFEGRPLLLEGRAILGSALLELGRESEAAAAYAEVASLFEWIRGGLRAEHMEPFVSRPDVQRLLVRTVETLESLGREADATPLKPWIRSG